MISDPQETEIEGSEDISPGNSVSSGDGSVGTSSSFTSGSGNSFNSTGDDGEDAVTKRENRFLGLAKLFFLLFLLSLAAIVSYFWWKNATEAEEETYKNAFHQFAGKIIQVFFSRVDYRVASATTLAASLSSQARQSEMTWPNVSFANFERRTAASRRLTSASTVWFAPLVQPEQRGPWEDYAVENQSDLSNNFTDPYTGGDVLALGVTPDVLAVSDSPATSSPYREVSWSVEDGMFKFEDAAAVTQEYQVYYAPIWQSAPSSFTSSVAMFDQPSEEMRNAVLVNMVAMKSSLFSRSQVNGTMDSIVGAYEDGPHVFLYTPIFQDLEEEDQTVAGGLTMDIDWASFWSHSVDGIEGALTIVLESTCNQTFTFEMDKSQVSFIGEGSIAYDNELGLAMDSTFEDFADLLGYDEGNGSICSYRIHIYPTQSFEYQFLTDSPTRAALGFSGIFLLTAIVFFLYDCMIERYVSCAIVVFLLLIYRLLTVSSTNSSIPFSQSPSQGGRGFQTQFCHYQITFPN
jgi:hypothetical protein